jgi:hypothetical protein
MDYERRQALCRRIELRKKAGNLEKDGENKKGTLEGGFI